MTATPRTPTQNQLLAAVLRQHAELRERIACCEQLADRLDAGALEPARLLDEVTALRHAFDEHNQLEERALRPILLAAGGLGGATGALVIDDHVDQHRAIRHELGTAASSGLRAVLASLRDHLDTEEHHWLRRGLVQTE